MIDIMAPLSPQFQIKNKFRDIANIETQMVTFNTSLSYPKFNKNDEPIRWLNTEIKGRIESQRYILADSMNSSPKKNWINQGDVPQKKLELKNIKTKIRGIDSLRTLVPDFISDLNWLPRTG